MLGAGTKSSAKCFLAEKRLERLKRAEQTLLVERLEPLEQASLRCVQSDGGAIRRSNGKFFRTISDESMEFEASWFAHRTV